MRIFKPELILDCTKRFIQIFLDTSFTGQPPFNYNEIVRNSDHQLPNLIIKDQSQDVLVEIQRMQRVISKQCPLHHIVLNNQNIKKLANLLAESALSGHWILIEDF